MENVREDRTDAAPQFTYCGLDCFEPFNEKVKHFGLLLAFFSSREVHKEMLYSMYTDALIIRIHCFLSLSLDYCKIYQM